jgi:hypothetical protein
VQLEIREAIYERKPIIAIFEDDERHGNSSSRPRGAPAPRPTAALSGAEPAAPPRHPTWPGP